MKSPTDRYDSCSICDQPFTTDEWLDRHTDSDGNDCHEGCCDVCAAEDLESMDLEDQWTVLNRVPTAAPPAPCRLRPLAIGCGNRRTLRIWTNASPTNAPMWVQNDDCTPFDDESVSGDGHGLGWPDSYRDGYIGD